MTNSNRHNERHIPAGSRMEKTSNPIQHAISVIRHEGFVTFFALLTKKTYYQIKLIVVNQRLKRSLPAGAKVIKLEDIYQNPPVLLHQSPVDIIIYIHSSTAEFKECVDSVLKHTSQPFTIMLVDDASDTDTHRYLADLARLNGFVLLHNDQMMGYSHALSQALERCSGEYALFLKYNVIVTPGWLDGLMACIQSDAKFGLTGPLSNRSVTLTSSKDVPINNQADPVIDNPSPAQTGELITAYSRRIYPGMQQLDDACLLVRRQVIDTLGNHEKDFYLQAHSAGWQLALADNAYIFQLQPDQALQDGSLNLAQPVITVPASEAPQSVAPESDSCNRHDRILEGIYAHNRHILERETLIQRGRERFNHERLLFILPVKAAGGGSNSVFLAAQAMRKMGVEAEIMNLEIYRRSFEKSYPNLDVPLIFGEIADIPTLAARYDAVVATANDTVSWIAPVLDELPDIAIGYYIQDYEPYFYRTDSEGYRIAAASYTVIPDQARCVITQWISDQVWQHHRLSCHIVGGHIDTDLFRPRPCPDSLSSGRPIRIAAMIRPSSERRSPRMTMDILRHASKMYSAKLEFLLFGCDFFDPGFALLPMDFPWRLAGELRPAQIANLLNQSDIFVDYSVFQGLGATALESMSCGLATIVPSHGGTSAFAKHEENCLVVDTQDQNACFSALQRLIEDDGLRHKLQMNAISTGVKFFPELPAYNILKALFPQDS
jgi:glycosyltransferase involved in cell wall biosynthesis